MSDLAGFDVGYDRLLHTYRLDCVDCGNLVGQYRDRPVLSSLVTAAERHQCVTGFTLAVKVTRPGVSA